MKAQLLTIVVSLAATAIVNGQTETIALWTFEQSVPDGTGQANGPYQPETGAGQASGLHASASTSWTNPAGNGSAESWSASQWAIGDYYQFQVSTLGYSNIQLTWDQTRSGTGPSEFALTYSTDGASFQTALTYSVTDTAWVNTTYKEASTFGADLSYLSPELGNQETLFVRLEAAGAAGGAAGTVRVDNFHVTATAVPEPRGLLAIGGMGLLLLRLRRRHAA